MQSASLLAPSRLEAIQPPRSRLFAIEPLALQTPAVESFTSYLMRLAEAHCVQLGTLIHGAVASRLQNAFLAQGPSRHVTIFLRAAALLNSHGVSAADWMQALTALTLRPDLPLLTMLPWAQVVSSRQLVPPSAVVSLLFREVAGLAWHASPVFCHHGACGSSLHVN